MPPQFAPTPDLFDFLRQVYKEWDETSKVVIHNVEQTFTLEELPNDAVERFAAFSRKYLTLNPISTAGQVGADFGVTLVDGKQFAIARGSARNLFGTSGGISMVGPNSVPDLLPPAFEIPITGKR